MMVQSLGSRQGCVPGPPFGRIIAEWVERETDEENELAISPLVILAERLGMDTSRLRKLRNGKLPWINFNLADKIVCICTDGLGWRSDPELWAIYGTYDFSWLDRKHPLVAA